MQIGIFSMGRKNSQRCPNKMLRNFGNTTLTDIVLSKLAKFENSFFAGLEYEFEKKCEHRGVEFIKRSKESANIDAPIVRILEFLDEAEYEKVLFISACLPLLRASTIEEFFSFCLAEPDRPATLCIKRNNYFLDKHFNPINFNPKAKTLNTKTVQPIYEFANALYYYDRKEFLSEGRYWGWNDVRCCAVDWGSEFIDIDTEEDFKIAEALWKNECVSCGL